LKKVLLPIGSAFLAYQFYQMIFALHIRSGINYHLGIDLLLAWIIALFGTGIFALIGFAYPTSRLIGSSYYRLRNPKRLRFWYSAIRVEYFKRLLLLFFWGSKKNRNKYFNGTREGIRNFIYQTHQSEFGHLGALLLVALANVLTLLQRHYAISVFLFALNIIGNFYPIILQRHHRIRLARFINS
jgi:hypothetical protein